MNHPQVYDLKAAELALLAKLGIKLPTSKPVNQFKEATCKHTKTIDLSPLSAEVTRNCACCGSVSVTYADYVKRQDREGFAIRTVAKPSNKVTRYHVYNVLSCAHCSDEMMQKMSNDKLIEMVHRLREKVIDVQQAQKLQESDK